MREYDYYSWLDFLKVRENRKIVIWGTGKTGVEAFEVLKNDTCIVEIVDKSPNMIGKDVNGYIVKNVVDVLNGPMEDVVVLIAHQYVYQAIEELQRIGVLYYFHYETIVYNREHLHEYVFEQEKECDYSWVAGGCYAHGMGIYEGICLTNSLEAFRYNYDRGYRIFECDITFVENEVILCHVGKPFEFLLECSGDTLKSRERNIWNSMNEKGEPIAFSKLKEEKIFGRFTPLKFVDLLQVLTEYKDVRIIPDVSHAGGSERLEWIINLVKEQEPNLLSQFIFEINVEEAKYVDVVKTIAPNSSIFLIHDHRQFVDKRCTDEELIKICVEAKVKLLMVGIPRISENLLRVAKLSNVFIGAYCWINSEETVNRLKAMGVSFFCTESFVV